MQFFQQQMLQSLGNLVLARINTGLLQYARCVDTGLREQFAETGIFCLKCDFLEAPMIECHVPNIAVYDVPQPQLLFGNVA
jgi:hypothetical protein